MAAAVLAAGGMGLAEATQDESARAQTSNDEITTDAAVEPQWPIELAAGLDSVEAGNGFDDLQAFGAMIGDARVVGLGEPTHGSREVFQLKHRLVEYLAERKGFSVFAIEASAPDTEHVNRYVLEGVGDSRDVIARMGFWTWHTQEVHDLVVWMRAWKLERERAGDPRRLTFRGFDMQDGQSAMDEVLGFLESADEQLAREVADAYDRCARAVPAPDPFGAAALVLPAEGLHGKRLTLSGWVRTEDVEGWAGFWIRCDAAEGPTAAFDNMQATAPRETTSWARYEAAVDVPEACTSVVLGLLSVGAGAAWFDDLEVAADGNPLQLPDRIDAAFEAAGGLDAWTGGGVTGNAGYVVEQAEGAGRDGSGGAVIRRIEPGDGIVSAAEAAALALEVEQRLAAEHARLIERTDEARAGWALHMARVVRQNVDMKASSNPTLVRDTAMAENVRWLLEQDPSRPADTRIAVWAHNAHVHRQSEQAMGWHLDQALGESHVVVGFATSTGTYRAFAWDRSGLGTFPLIEPVDGSLERALDTLPMQTALVDLRAAENDERANRVLGETTLLRSIGAMEVPLGQFYPVNLARSYDIIAWIRETTAAEPLR